MEIHWIIPGEQFSITRTDLHDLIELLPPDVEMRVINIITASRHETVVCVRGDGPYHLTERDWRAVLDAVRERRIAAREALLDPVRRVGKAH